MSQNTPQKQLFDMLVSKNFDIQALDSRTGRGPVDEKGQPDMTAADEFRFDFVTQSGRNYGSVVVLFGDDNNLTMFFGDNVGKGMEGEDKQEWFDFLYQMKQFATKNFLDFQPENITRLKYTKQGQAAIKEGLFESWQGKGNMSWNGQPTEARLVIKHKKALGEGEARFRFIESIYIETADSERFKLKSRSLTAAKAMLEHIRQGGNPYDARAQHINEIVEELGVLSRFRRANANKVLEGDTKNLVEQTDAYYRNMHSVLKHLGTSRGYQGYFESWTPADVNEGNLVVEDLKQLFVEQTIDHRIEEALPILARITQEADGMKEAQIFESWINNLVEGTWALPETPEQKQELIDLMSKDFPVGADATNATEQLYNILGDDQLFDRLQELADADANADARSVVMTRLQELSSASPDVEAVLGQLQTTNPAEPEPDDMAQDVEGDEQLPQSVEEQGVAEEQLDEIDFSNELGKLAISDEEIIGHSTKSGTIGSRTVYLFKNGSDRIYFFAGDKKIDALLYLHQDRLMAMKNFSENKGLIYNLFQYVVGMLKQKIKLSAVDKLTPDGIKWIVNQSTKANGFTITDGKGQPIDAKNLYAEWDKARTSGQHGPTEIVIKESKIGMKLRENENRLMPMDIFGATMLVNSTEYMSDLYESKEQGVAEGSDSYTVANDPDKPGMYSYKEIGHALQSGHSDNAKIYKNNKFLSTISDARKSDVAEDQCNMTTEGEYCPKHGLEECGIYEYTGNWTNFGLEESDELTRLKKLALGK